MHEHMKISELLAIFDQEQRREVMFYGSRREVTPEVVRHVDVDAHEGYILYSQLDTGNADRVISEQLDYFAGLQLEVEWKLYGHDAPPDLGARLEAHGMTPEEPESVMVLDMEDAPAFYWQPVRADVRRITDAAGIVDVIAVKREVWGGTQEWLLDAMTRMLDEPDDLTRIYVAYVDGRPASAARMHFHPPGQFASLWGGSTVAGYRNRGLYTALLATRAQEARRRGFRFLSVDASEMSRPILERHGFRFLTTATAYKWSSPQRGSLT
jgi:hypothetical protein